jgi:hypothetical protein
MLKSWQDKFPTVFTKYHHYIANLTSEEAVATDMLLIFLQKLDLLNEKVVTVLFRKISQHSKLLPLLELLTRLHYLNADTLPLVLAESNYEELAHRVESIANHLSLELLHFAFSSSDTKSCLVFMQKTLKTGVDKASVLNFLSTLETIAGLSRAITFFEHSPYTYKKDHLHILAMLTEVLANPLSQVIFDARTRTSGDYTEPAEPLRDKSLAQAVIQALLKCKSYEERISVFFDSFVVHRPSQASLRHFVEINVEEIVTSQLNNYCLEQVQSITTKEDYLRVKALINKLHTTGGDQPVIDAIKYNAASFVESEDIYSSRNYEAHMEEIAQLVRTPQTNLQDFTQQLKESKGYQFMETSRMQNLGILSSSSVLHSEDSLPKKGLSVSYQQ